MKTPFLAAALVAACAVAHATIVGSTGVPAPASSAASGVDPAVAARRAADAAEINRATALIQAGQQQAAIERVLDPLIAAQQAEYGARKDATLYCANSPTESLLYLMQAANAQQAAVVLDGTWCNALFMRGYAELDLGKVAAAEADFGRALALSPNNPHYLSEMGALHAKRREWNEALAFYHRAEEAAKAFSAEGRADWELGAALRGIGYIDVELGKLDEAEAAYRRCLAIDPQDKKAQGELGYVLNLRLKAGQAK